MRRLALVLTLLASPLWAVEPGEVLDDPALESRAREVSQGLRCPVCQNDTIDESNAALASDLRVILRERLVAGDTDQEAVNFLVARYGEFILLEPDKGGINLILWGAAPLLLVLALFVGWRTTQRKAETQSLSPEEKAELDKLLSS
jgi:cytochrome c-type biogenesis protein CcmH